MSNQWNQHGLAIQKYTKGDEIIYVQTDHNMVELDGRLIRWEDYTEVTMVNLVEGYYNQQYTLANEYLDSLPSNYFWSNGGIKAQHKDEVMGGFYNHLNSNAVSGNIKHATGETSDWVGLNKMSQMHNGNYHINFRDNARNDIMQ